MHKKRLIARIDIKNDSVIKGIQLEGLRKIGDPADISEEYYLNGIDELLFMDAVASYYDRNSLLEMIKESSKNIFIPITVGGGIRSLDDIQRALDHGADKVAINTMAINEPDFIYKAAKRFGSQCIVASITAKKNGTSYWEAYTANGRDNSGRDAIQWIKQLQELGAGEIMITSIDQEGTRLGFDIELCKIARESTRVPIIVCGGAGNKLHLSHLCEQVDIDAIAIASILHYKTHTIPEIKLCLSNSGVEVRL